MYDDYVPGTIAQLLSIDWDGYDPERDLLGWGPLKGPDSWYLVQ